MAETKQMLKFYKGGQQPTEVGSIWFKDGLLSVVGTSGLEYFSGVQDASWDATSKKLTIVKANGTDKVELDFSDVASAQILGKLREDLTALSSTVDGIDDRLEAVETVVGDENSGLVKQVAANEAAIATLNGDAETAGSVAKAVADAVAAEKERAEGVEGDLQDAIDAVEATVEAQGEDLETIKGVLGLGESGDNKTVSDLIDEKIDALAGGDTATGEYVTVGVTSENGEVTEVTIDEAKLKAALKGLSDAIEGEAETARAAEEANANAAQAAADEAARAHERVDALITGEGINADIIESFKELNDYLADHEDVKEGILDAIQALEDQVGEGTVDERIAAAKEEINAVILENEQVAAEALTDLNTRITTLENLGITNEFTGVKNRLSTLEDTVAALPEDIAEAKKAGDDAAEALNTYIGTNDAAVAAAQKAADDAAAAVTTLAEGAVADNADAIEAVSEEVKAIKADLANGVGMYWYSFE